MFGGPRVFQIDGPFYLQLTIQSIYSSSVPQEDTKGSVKCYREGGLGQMFDQKTMNPHQYPLATGAILGSGVSVSETVS